MILFEIETPVAVERIEELLSVIGAHAVFIGPYELSVSLGVPREPPYPKVAGAIERFAVGCRTRGIPFRYPTDNAEAAPRSLRALLLTVGVDIRFVHSAAAAAFGEARK